MKIFILCEFFNKNAGKILSIWDKDLFLFLVFNENLRKNTFKFGL